MPPRLPGLDCVSRWPRQQYAKPENHQDDNRQTSYGPATLPFQSQLFGVSPLDPVIFVAVALLMLLVAQLAGLIPSRRASRVDPAVALRYE